MNKKQQHLQRVEQLKQKVQEHPSLEEMKKSIILEKIEEWKHDEDAMDLIPNKLLELYENDLKPILVEIGFI